MACIANLEDVSNSFVEHVKSFEEQLKLFLTKRDYYQQKMKNFKQDLEMLDQIKILRCLHEETVDATDAKQEDDRTDQATGDSKLESTGDLKPAQGDEQAAKIDDEKLSGSDEMKEPKESADVEQADHEGTLMSLINRKDDKHCLEKVTVYCNKMLEEFNEQLLDRVKLEMSSLIKTIEENKKIKKIENRLYNLDMLLLDVKQHVKDQNLLTYGFVQNQNSANACNDPTIFADLCLSHKNQLDLMFKSYQKVISIRKKFQNSKRELTYSLLARLKTIMICETELNSLNWHVLLYAESLKKLKRSLDVVDQINLAPKVYFRVFEEINRRNKFNYFFDLWSNFIVQINRRLIEAENAQRDEFRQTISSHFLKSFFPRFDDQVPEFAMQPPEPFDRDLPRIDERQFLRFIEQNRQFDDRLDAQDSLLNGLVHRLNGLESAKLAKADCMKVDDCPKLDDCPKVDEPKTDEKMAESLGEPEISESERECLARFVGSLFPLKSKAGEDRRIEAVKQRLNDEYERKLNALKLEYRQKLDEELKNLKENPDDLAYTLNCQRDCSGEQADAAGGLTAGSLSAGTLNAGTPNAGTLNAGNMSTGDCLATEANLPNDLTSSNISNNISATINAPTENAQQTASQNQRPSPAIFLNCKNLITELLSAKYSDFQENDQPHNLFISFVSTILHISLPRTYFF